MGFYSINFYLTCSFSYLADVVRLLMPCFHFCSASILSLCLCFLLILVKEIWNLVNLLKKDQMVSSLSALKTDFLGSFVSFHSNQFDHIVLSQKPTTYSNYQPIELFQLHHLYCKSWCFPLLSQLDFSFFFISLVFNLLFYFDRIHRSIFLIEIWVLDLKP